PQIVERRLLLQATEVHVLVPGQELAFPDEPEQRAAHREEPHARALRDLSDMIQHLLTLARRIGAFLQPGLDVVLGAVQRRRAGMLLAMIHDGVSSGSLADLDRARPAARADELRGRADRQAVPGD